MKKFLILGVMSLALVACKSTDSKTTEETWQQRNYEECLKQEFQVAKALKNTDAQAHAHAKRACRRLLPGKNYK